MPLPEDFPCLLVRAGDPEPTLTTERLPTDQLPAGDVTMRVHYSSLNYKDALATQGNRGIVAALPHIPGIDAAGEVLESTDERFQPGEQILVTGYDLGQKHWGGWSELVRVPANWCIKLPADLTTREAMVLGTAGFTAAQCVNALQTNGTLPESGEVVVTGSTGGVGSMAIRMLAKLGYTVVAATGKLDQQSALQEMGAARVIDRREFAAETPRPMLSARWAGGIDTVGGNLLTHLLRSTQYGGTIAACGLVAGAELSMTVYPFILRGINLCGIASADCPLERRLEIWRLLAGDWKPGHLDAWVTEITMPEMQEQVTNMLNGRVAGRILLRVAADS